ncbi:hypothetical protein QOZ80_4AG0300140 [Eleusine coracana subsp. coracana]|nr:hypothetical protein QOZ80_4AG0300140 [Eleusine coracana subsp. coracana]
MDVLNWNAQCEKIDAADKVLDENLPTLRAPKDCRTTKAVQDWRSKKKVLAAARSVVNITPISEDGSTKMQFSGFILDRYEHGGIQFSIVVTCSRFICKDGRKLDPLPKFSVGLPDRKTIEAKLFHFSDHYDIAFLLLPMETSLDIPCFGCCPDYSQEVFVLGRDKDASLRVRRGVISWTEESDSIGCSHYMFLDGEVPQGGTGGPVIDHDGNFRGMAFQTCRSACTWFEFEDSSSVDVELLECISDYNLKSGYIADMVHLNSPARKYKTCEGNVIVSLNGHRRLSLPKLEDYLLSLGWQNLIYSASTVDLKLEVCDLMKGRRRLITVPVGFCSAPESAPTPRASG